MGPYLSRGIRFVSTYRAYHVDEHGHFRGVPQILSAETDEDAIAHVKQLLDGYDVELWEGGRLVTKLKRRD